MSSHNKDGITNSNDLTFENVQGNISNRDSDHGVLVIKVFNRLRK
jgi:hypothetical protein